MLRSIDAPWGQDEIFYLDSLPAEKYQFEFNGQIHTCFVNEKRLGLPIANFIVEQTKKSLQTGCYKFNTGNSTYPQTTFIFINSGNLQTNWLPQRIVFDTLTKTNPNNYMSVHFLVNDISIGVHGSIYQKKSKDWIYGKKAELVRAIFTSTVGINRGPYEYNYTKSCRTKAHGYMEPSWLDDLLLDYEHYASLLEEYSIYEKH